MLDEVCDLNGGGVYSIINTFNNKLYIGATRSFEDRLKRHQSLLRNNKHHCEHLQNSYNKYGVENFKIIILEVVVNLDDIWQREHLWWCNYSKLGYILFNGEPNGLGRPKLSSKQQEEINEKISKTMKTKISSGDRLSGWESMVAKYGLDQASNLKYSFDKDSGKRAGEAPRIDRTLEHNKNISKALKGLGMVKVSCFYCGGEYSQGAGISRHKRACENNFKNFSS